MLIFSDEIIQRHTRLRSTATKLITHEQTRVQTGNISSGVILNKLFGTIYRGSVQWWCCPWWECGTCLLCRVRACRSALARSSDWGTCEGVVSVESNTRIREKIIQGYDIKRHETDSTETTASGMKPGHC